MEDEAIGGLAGKPFQRREGVYKDMEQWTRIRLEVLRDGKSKRQVLRENRIHWTTLEKILRHPQPPGYRIGVEPGSPRENGYNESFNGKLRDGLLNGEVFCTLREAQVLIDGWRNDYNTIRPHSALGYRPPAPEVVVPWIAPEGGRATAF